jgi:putative MATE family efflux protein
MESASTPTSIIRLALPMMAAMLAQSIYNMTDMFFIGQTRDTDMVAAVSLVFPVFMFSQALGNVFATGSSSYISRMLGAKNIEEAKNTSSVCVYLSLLAGLLVAVLQLSFKTPILIFIGTSENTFAYANGYYSVVTIFMPVAVVGTLFSGILRSVGLTDKAMTLQLIGIILNIILDPIFISVSGWGTKGAAWATIAGQLACFFYGLWYFCSKKSLISIQFKNIMPNRTMLRELFSIGIPAGLSNMLMIIASILSNRIAAGYGNHAVAGSGVQMRIASLCFMLVFALAQGYQPFAGFNYGAKNYKRLKKGFRFTLIFSTILCGVGCIVFFIFGDILVRFFINDTKTIEVGAVMLRAFIPGLFFLGIQTTLMTTYQALGKSFEATLVTLGRQLLFYVPLLFILNSLFGFSGFIFAMPVSDIFSTVLALVMSRSVFKMLRVNSFPPGNS